jgi:hypothetical protein
MLNEYSTPYLATYAFPALFPYGRGDPFGFSVGHAKVSLSDKLKHLINYCHELDGQLHFPFQEDERFCFWAYNLKYRHMSNSQGSVFINQNPDIANMSFQELINNASLGVNNPVLKRLQRYIANVPGTPSYWHNTSKDLEAIILTKGPPHVFFTYTYADNYEPELHRILKIPAGASLTAIQKKLKSNPVITQKFFLKKFEAFLEEFVVKKYGCTPEHGGYYWYRYEWQHRGGIHVHGVYRMNNTTPDPYELSARALEGHNQKVELLEKGIEEEYWTEEAKTQIAEGLKAEGDLCTLHDKFISSDLPISDEGYIRPTVKPMSKRCTEIELDQVLNDLMDLKMAVNNHHCKVGGCVKEFNGVLQRCRYKFPKELSDSTLIKYSQQLFDNNRIGPTMLNIIAKRVHSQNIVGHIEEHLRVWRANTDSALIHDLTRVLKYIAKYASKPEIKSNPCLQAYEEIFNDTRGEETDVQKSLKKVMMHVLGQRDVSLYEACHQLSGLPLHKSNILVVTANLQAGNKIHLNEETNEIEKGTSLVDLYKERYKYSEEDLSTMNFIKFGTFYKNKLQIVDKGLPTQRQILCKQSHPDHIALRIFQKFSSNPKNPQYNLFCKFQLLRFKPWVDNFSNALGENIVQDEADDCYRVAWHEFLNTEIAKTLVPNWAEIVRNAHQTLEEFGAETDENDLLIDGEDRQTTTNLQTDWQQAIWDGDTENLIENQLQDNLHDIQMDVDQGFGRLTDRHYFESHELLRNLLDSPDFTDWISKQKTLSPPTRTTRPQVHPESLRTEQRKAFDILCRFRDRLSIAENTLNSEIPQLLMRVEGTAGTGKYIN